jgi:hypothetical protein
MLEENKSIREAFEKANDSLMLMNEEQRQDHDRMIQEMKEYKLDLEQIPESLRNNRGTKLLESQILSIQNELKTLIQGTHRIPTLAIIVKRPPRGLSRFDPRNLATDKYSLYFICAHTLQPVACGPEGEGFEFKKLKDSISSFLKKVGPLIRISLIVLKVAVSMYGVPLPLPNLSHLGVDASKEYLNDAINTFCDESAPNILDDIEKSIENGLQNSDDIMTKLNLSTECQREAYESILNFLEDQQYPKPWKLGLVMETSQSGITQWIKDDPNVIRSFHDNNGMRKPIK